MGRALMCRGIKTMMMGWDGILSVMLKEGSEEG